MRLFGRQRTPSSLYLSMRDSTYNTDDRRYAVVEDVKNNRGNVNIFIYCTFFMHQHLDILLYVTLIERRY